MSGGPTDLQPNLSSDPGVVPAAVDAAPPRPQGGAKESASAAIGRMCGNNYCRGLEHPLTLSTAS